MQILSHKSIKTIFCKKRHTNASIKTTLAADQIANRLRYAIPGSVYRRTAKSGGTIEALDDPMTAPADSYTVLEWVGYDGDSFESFESGTNRKPGWEWVYVMVDFKLSEQHLNHPGFQFGILHRNRSIFPFLGGNTLFGFPGPTNNSYFSRGRNFRNPKPTRVRNLIPSFN